MKKWLLLLSMVPFFASPAWSMEDEEAEKRKGYTLNFMWINDQYNFERFPNTYLLPIKNIHDDSEWTEKEGTERMKKNYLTPLFTWREKNPNALCLNFWYDSQFTTDDAVINTTNLIKEFSSEKKGCPLILRDIRELDPVKKYPEVFAKNIPLYFRVDLLRVIASVEEKQGAFFVYADMGVSPLSKEELFDDETILKLIDNGYIMMKNPRANENHAYENGFFIVNHEDTNVLKAMKDAIIDPSIRRAERGLKKGYWYDNEQAAFHDRSTAERFNILRMNQIVFSAYVPMNEYLKFLKGKTRLYHQTVYSGPGDEIFKGNLSLTDIFKDDTLLPAFEYGPAGSETRNLATTLGSFGIPIKSNVKSPVSHFYR